MLSKQRHDIELKKYFKNKLECMGNVTKPKKCSDLEFYMNDKLYEMRRKNKSEIKIERQPMDHIDFESMNNNDIIRLTYQTMIMKKYDEMFGLNDMNSMSSSNKKEEDAKIQKINNLINKNRQNEKSYQSKMEKSVNEMNQFKLRKNSVVELLKNEDVDHTEKMNARRDYMRLLNEEIELYDKNKVRELRSKEVMSYNEE